MVADDQCEDSSEKKKTIIKFICDKSAVLSDPYFGSDDGYTVFLCGKLHIHVSSQNKLQAIVKLIIQLRELLRVEHYVIFEKLVLE